MSTQPSETFDWRKDLEDRRRIWAELHAPRSPVDQLSDEHRVTKKNPKPPLLHFGLPIDDPILYKYAEEHGLTEYWPCAPTRVSPTTLFAVTAKLSEDVQYDLGVSFPFRATADCDTVLTLYNNYTMDDKMLIEEDQEDVIQLVQEDLGLDKSVRPRWYFDISDPWKLNRVVYF